MELYSTLSGKKEVIAKPPRGKKTNLFVCGPTVYDDAHIGHARIYVFFDVFAKVLTRYGFNPYYLQNITDIDDRIIARAREAGEDPLAFAKRQTKSYLRDMKLLGVTAVDTYAPATEHIPEVIRQVQALMVTGYAYEIPNEGIYFEVGKFSGYGKLSRRTAGDAVDAVSRIDESIGKRSRADFCVWKFARDDEPSWEAPFGNGRPGWHIEDTAISEKYFGPQYDIHGGGLDLKFPHHEAEIAQQEAASGKEPFVKVWMHVGLLNVNGAKMSKSAGNFMTIKEFLKAYPPELLRFMLLRHHYRSPIDYTDGLMRESRAALQGIYHFLARLSLIAARGRATAHTGALVARAEDTFQTALEDDIHTPGALAAIFALIHELQPDIWKLTKADSKRVTAWIQEGLTLLGIAYRPEKLPRHVASLAKRRELSRDSKQFTQGDALRKEIEAVGYTVEDTPVGQLILKK
jgi:cysteinyl-tRNA synthetase